MAEFAEVPRNQDSFPPGCSEPSDDPAKGGSGACHTPAKESFFAGPCGILALRAVLSSTCAEQHVFFSPFWVTCSQT